MSSSIALVNVIIPTLAEARRADALWRAIDGVLKQTGVSAIPIVVVNGSRFDPNVLARLRELKDIRLQEEARGGLIYAMGVGRRLVEAPFFSFLDDDDEYLPHALETRVKAMRSDERIDAVISNGYRFDGSVRSVSASNLKMAASDPLGSLLENNWLTSCGGLYRTDRLSAEFFSDTTEFAEWTYLAFKLCLNHKIAFVESPSYIIHDTAGSLSKSVNYSTALAGVMKRVLDLPLPPKARNSVGRKYGAALHDLSTHYLGTGQRYAAWKCHIRSLRQPGGLRFFLYGRRFVGL